MKPVNLSELTDQELMEEEKKRKKDRTTIAFLIGFMVGVAIFSLVKNGFGFFTFFPIFFIPIFMSNDKNYKDVQAEIQSRKSK